jgi:5-methylcytosine-specific restriction endonuclease McrBC regulatory subunit McrC
MLLSLTEYGKPERWTGGTDLLDGLRAEAARWKAVLGLAVSPFSIEYGGRGEHLVRARGVTGFIQAGDVSVEIQPKFLPAASGHAWRQALWQILAAVEEQPGIGAATRAGLGEEESFPDLLGWTFLRSMEQARLEGLPRGYVETTGRLDVLRGRIDTGRIAELVSQPYRLPCVYDVYCEDTALNRLLRWAAQRLSSSVRSPRLSRMLADAASAFADVGSAPPGLIEAERLSLPVQSQHLLPALQVARLLLRRQSLEHRSEDLAAPGFLWNSAEIFERFVGRLLQQACHARPGWSLARTGQLLARADGEVAVPSDVFTYPDYRLMQGARTLLLLDAKYKVWRRAGQPRTGDIYQVMAGGRINRCETVCLVYPCPGAERKAPLRWQLQAEALPRFLSALFVDLTRMGEPDGEETLVRQLDEDLATAGWV